MRFTKVVTLTSPNGLAQLFKPGDEVPEWAAALVGPHVTDAEAAAPKRTPKPSGSRARSRNGVTAPKPAVTSEEW